MSKYLLEVTSNSEESIECDIFVFDDVNNMEKYYNRINNEGVKISKKELKCKKRVILNRHTTNSLYMYGFDSSGKNAIISTEKNLYKIIPYSYIHKIY